MTTPTTVDTTVFSLAGGRTDVYGSAPGGFEDPCPLGVRFFNPTTHLDVWMTNYVGDITYRSVIPGGFANATIPLNLPRGIGADQVGFDRIAALYTRVQVVDLRSAEIAWEGRIEEPARQTGPDTWQLSALGSMIAASDIQRPVFYVDSSLDRWTATERMTSLLKFWSDPDHKYFVTDKDEALLTLNAAMSADMITVGGTQLYAFRWDSHGFDQAYARFTTTHGGRSTDIDGTNPKSGIFVCIAVSDNPTVDHTAFSSGEQTKTNVIVTDFSDTNQRVIAVGLNSTNPNGVNAATDSSTSFVLRNPIVVAQRRDRTGAQLNTAASYPHSYVLVSEVVEDVIGRYLCGGWSELGMNIPWPGSVRYQDARVDTSCTTQILNLTFPDGATAADILNTLIDQVQPDAYWALWESSEGLLASGAPTGYRFEYSTWPANFGYQATSEDGFEGKPDGASLYNYITHRYPDVNDGSVMHAQTSWHGLEMAPELLAGGFTRGVVVNKSDPTDGTTAIAQANDYLNTAKRIQNSGSLTVRRPIPMYDSGLNSAEGGMRMIDPHMIRPGKLVRVMDLPPRSGLGDMSFGDVTPTLALDGTLFRVVAVDYNSSDGAATLELDEVPTWQISTQIGKGAIGKSKPVRIQ